jgi:hypothetical protein
MKMNADKRHPRIKAPTDQSTHGSKHPDVFIRGFSSVGLRRHQRAVAYLLALQTVLP